MAITAFPGPADITVPYEQMITDGININVNPWNIDNPHPGFGKDPNIINEYGHCQYPMWVDSKIEFNPDGTGKRLVVNNEAEHKAHVEPEVKAPAWPK